MTSLQAAASPSPRTVALAFAALVLGAIAMGASPIFVRMADVGPQASAFWRTALALPFLAIWARVEDFPLLPTRPHVDRSVMLAGLFFAGDLFFWHLAVLNTTVANATFLATTAPIWVALGAWFLLGEVVGWRTIAGLALCLAGGAALVGQSYGFAPQRLTGDLYGVITAVFFGGYMLAMRAARAQLSAGALAYVSTAVTAAALFVIALVLEPSLVPRSLGGAAALLALALISQVGGQGLLAVALGTLPATFSSLVIFAEAVAAAAFGWIVLGEALGALQAAGGMMILAGIYTARPRPSHAPEPGVGL
jgi:drug/metabolite transporter (DMT)-like permease